MSTITRLITIMTQQNGYMLNAEDAFAVSKMCYTIAGILFVIFIALVLHYKNNDKQTE